MVVLEQPPLPAADPGQNHVPFRRFRESRATITHPSYGQATLPRIQPQHAKP